MTSTENPGAGHRKRLKERFLKASLDGFHDYEVLEILLTYAIPRRDVKPLAKRLIVHFKSLGRVFDASLEELSAVSGVGESTAILIALVREMAAAYVNEDIRGKNIIRSPKDAVDFIDLKASEEPDEKLLAIYLNSKNEVLGFEALCEGAVDASSLSPKKVIETAFKYNARSIIFVHSRKGKASPSKIERELAKELQAAASAVDIIIHDHIIVGKGTRLSAREEGWLEGG